MRGLRANGAGLVLAMLTMLLSTMPASATTQDEFDKAVMCCWAHSSTVDAYCSTPDACSWGYESCQSVHFREFDNSDSVGALFCGAMGNRGENDEAIQLFVPPAPQETSDGEVLEVSPAVAKSLRAATKVMQLQSRGASSEELDSVAGDEVEISTEESESGARTVTIRGEGTDDIVLRFDADGTLQKEDEDE